MAMDSNARSKTWRDVLINSLGRLLEEFLICNRLHIANEDGVLTTFESNRSNTNIDLTVFDSTIVNIINKWQCKEQ